MKGEGLSLKGIDPHRHRALKDEMQFAGLRFQVLGLQAELGLPEAACVASMCEVSGRLVESDRELSVGELRELIRRYQEDVKQQEEE